MMGYGWGWGVVILFYYGRYMVCFVLFSPVCGLVLWWAGRLLYGESVPAVGIRQSRSRHSRRRASQHIFEVTVIMGTLFWAAGRTPPPPPPPTVLHFIYPVYIYIFQLLFYPPHETIYMQYNSNITRPAALSMLLLLCMCIRRDVACCLFFHVQDNRVANVNSNTYMRILRRGYACYGLMYGQVSLLCRV